MFVTVTLSRNEIKQYRNEEKLLAILQTSRSIQKIVSWNIWDQAEHRVQSTYSEKMEEETPPSV